MGIVTKKPILSEDIASLYTSSLESLKLFVGLGNPGRQYAANRHNTGFMCLERLAELYDISWQDKRDFRSHFAQTDVGGTRIMLAKPQTYVNLSGEAVSKIAVFYKLTPKDIYIIHERNPPPLGHDRGLPDKEGFRPQRPEINPKPPGRGIAADPRRYRAEKAGANQPLRFCTGGFQPYRSSKTADGNQRSLQPDWRSRCRAA